MEKVTETIAFKVTKEDYERGQKIPRGFPLPDKLRAAYQKILKEAGV